MKTSLLRREARDRECQIRAPGCSFNNDETVLAHLSGAGMGLKHDDILASWACFHCHSLVDGRGDGIVSVPSRRRYHLEGMARTIEILIAEGKIGVK